MRQWRLLPVIGLGLLGAVIFGAANVAAADDDAWYFSIDAAYNSKYVWRGIILVDGSVFQPTATVGYKGLSFSVFGNLDLSDVNGTGGNFTEVDLTLDYSWSYEKLAFSVGVIRYVFPNTGFASTTELYAALGLDVPLSPTLTVYQDVDEADGTYATLAVGHTFEAVWQPCRAATMAVDLSATVGFGSSGYNNFYFGVNRSAFTDLLLSLGLPVRIGEHWTVTPSVNYSALLDGSIRSSMSKDSSVWGGLVLTCSF